MYEQSYIDDSRYIEMLWRSIPDDSGTHFNIANEYWSIFFMIGANNQVLLVGPSQAVITTRYTPGVEYWGIVFRAHVFMPHISKKALLQKRINLPVFDNNRFEFDEQLFEIPQYHEAAHLTQQLAQGGHITINRLVERALSGEARHLSDRSRQRHFAQTTGLSERRIASLQKARSAYRLLQLGVPIGEVVASTGYADQSHLTKALKLLAGQTPAEILRSNDI